MVKKTSPVHDTLNLQFKERDAAKQSSSKSSRPRTRRNATPSVHYSRQPGVHRWESPWPDDPYRRMSVEFPETLYQEIIKKQHATKPGLTKLQVITEALIIGLGIDTKKTVVSAPTTNDVQTPSTDKQEQTPNTQQL